MTREEIKEERLTCNNCEKQKIEDKSQIKIGGGFFTGWIQVTLLGGSTQINDLRKEKEFHFCGRTCLEEWVEEFTNW